MTLVTFFEVGDISNDSVPEIAAGRAFRLNRRR